METQRLLIREFTANDASFIYTLMNSPGWLRFIGDRNIDSLDAAKLHIKTQLIPGYSRSGFGFWCVVDKTTGTAIGMNGLIKRDNLKHVDIGFAFLPEKYGQGYAFESSVAVVDFAQNRLGLSKLIAITDQNNIASQGLLAKLGFESQGLVTVKEEWGESLLYEKLFNN